jgi:hypothetical protein
MVKRKEQENSMLKKHNKFLVLFEKKYLFIKKSLDLPIAMFKLSNLQIQFLAFLLASIFSVMKSKKNMFIS